MSVKVEWVGQISREGARDVLTTLRAFSEAEVTRRDNGHADEADTGPEEDQEQP